MTYNNAIPNANDFVIQSQGQLLGNFQELFKAFNANHIPFNQENQGQHSQTTLERQGGAPATAADECALYTFLGTGSQSQLFYRPDTNGVQIQMSYQSVINTGAQQQSFMAGPFIIYFGRVDNLAAGSNTITLTPASTQLITVHACCTSDNYVPSSFPKQSFIASPSTFTTNTFIVVLSPTNPPLPPFFFSLYYFAIGVV